MKSGCDFFIVAGLVAPWRTAKLGCDYKAMLGSRALSGVESCLIALFFSLHFCLTKSTAKVKRVRSYPPTANKNNGKLCKVGYNTMPWYDGLCKIVFGNTVSTFQLFWHCIILTAFGAALHVFQLFFSPQPSARPPHTHGLRSQPGGEVGFDCLGEEKAVLNIWWVRPRLLRWKLCLRRSFRLANSNFDRRLFPSLVKEFLTRCNTCRKKAKPKNQSCSAATSL